MPKKRHQSRPKQKDTQSRYAFSLLEVLIAMLLGAFLMLAVFETFFVSARYRMLAGEGHIRGISLSNALKDLASDMLAVSTGRVEERQVQSVDPIETQLQSKLLMPSMNFRDTFSLESHLEWTQFWGEKNSVAMRTRAWSSRFSRLPENVPQAGESLVVWWLYQGSPVRIEGWRSKDLRVSKTLKLPPNPKGLIRTQFFIDRTGNEREHVQVILPEATELELKYYDRSAPRSSWDAADETMLKTNRVPTAIEVRLRMQNEEIEHWIHIPCD